MLLTNLIATFLFAENSVVTKGIIYFRLNHSLIFHW